jgi:hypothetical protein
VRASPPRRLHVNAAMSESGWRSAARRRKCEAPSTFDRCEPVLLGAQRRQFSPAAARPRSGDRSSLRPRSARSYLEPGSRQGSPRTRMQSPLGFGFNINRSSPECVRARLSGSPDHNQETFYEQGRGRVSESQIQLTSSGRTVLPVAADTSAARHAATAAIDSSGRMMEGRLPSRMHVTK